jgi:hypothetical protein
MEDSVEQVNPLLRPLFATPSLLPNTVAGTASVLEGGAGAILVELAVPRSRIAPVMSTAVTGTVTIAAMAASTLLGAGPEVPLVGFSVAA